MDLKTTLAKGLKEMKVNKEAMAQEVDNPAESDYEYPCGLAVTLDNQTLKLLNLQVKDFAIGEEVVLECRAKVTNVRSETGRYGMGDSVGLQITHMEFEREEKSSGN